MEAALLAVDNRAGLVPLPVDGSKKEYSWPTSKSRKKHGKGRYVGRIAGLEGEAGMTFARRGPKLISADHTVRRTA